MARIVNIIKKFIKIIDYLEIIQLLHNFLILKLNQYIFVQIDIINQFILIKLIFLHLIKQKKLILLKYKLNKFQNHYLSIK